MDPWAHRSNAMKCKTCIWFVIKAKMQIETQGATPEKNLGRCRRHSPSANGFVPVFDTDWCGDHRLDENKI